jgi:hypothetical protein
MGTPQINHHRLVVSVLGGVAMILSLGTATGAHAQERSAFSKKDVEAAKRAATQSAAKAPTAQAAQAAPAPLGCRGPITQVLDVAFEGLKFTSAVYGTNPGGGEGGQFDKTPVLSTKVTLAQGTCLDAHVSAIVGSAQAYGVSSLTLFQVTLTRIAPPPAAGPRHMVGHYETSYGRPSPAVALETERDVDMYASNFFQRVGTGPHEVPPGTYQVDVWWAGAPNPGGAIGAAFVLKLYLR